MPGDSGESLADKSIFIAGATSGFGLSAVNACLEAGANVVGIGPDETAIESAKPAVYRECTWVAGDAAEPETAEAAVEQAVAQFGKLDGIYHVAGGSGRQWGDGPLHEISDVGWARTIALNQTSVFNSNRAALKVFMQQGRGAIVNMVTALAAAPSPTFFAAHAYATAKAGVAGMTRHLAAYYAPYNIRVNAVAPGCSDTPMAARARDNAEIQEYLKKRQPLDGGRMGQPSDLDELVVYLLSDAAKFVTGQVVAVDGGWSVSEGVERT